MFVLELRKAIEAQDLELLERAVDMVESRGYAHRLYVELKEAKLTHAVYIHFFQQEKLKIFRRKVLMFFLFLLKT